MIVVGVSGPGKLHVRDVPAPPGNGRALVRLERAGICGTDLKILDGAVPVAYPVIMGHEMVGVVSRPGPQGRMASGTRVMVNPAIHCRNCHLCDTDRTHLCHRGGLLGRDRDGVFAEEVALEEHLLHVVPDGIAPDAAGLLQVLGTVVHSQQTVPVMAGSVAVVIGLGVSGLLQVQLLRARGVARVIGVTRSAWKRDMATRLGALAVATPDEAAGVVADVSEGRGADLVVEAVGSASTVAQAIDICGSGGEVIVYGAVTGGGGQLPHYQLYFKEITLRYPRAARPGDYDRAIGLAASGRIELAPLVTACFPLEKASEALAAARSGDHLKVLLSP